MISQTAEYALRATVCLAGTGDRACTTRTLSRSTGVSSTYLSKILRRLSRAGLVTSQRGPRGGFVLASPPEEITVLDVVNAVDPPMRLDRCPLDLPAHAGGLCPLHQKLARTYSLIEETLRSSTLSELVGSGESGSGGCGFPATPLRPLPTRRVPEKEEAE